MNFYDVYVRTPVNKQAGKILNGKTLVESDISMQEMNYLVARLARKRKLLNKAIGITNKRQSKNLKRKLSGHGYSIRKKINPRAVDEWYRNGQAIQVLVREIAERKKQLGE